MMTVPENRRIVVARAEKALTQEDLAKAVGVSRQTINCIERGSGNPTLDLCKKICKTLNKSLDYLFGEEE